ncbi:hypothetical protein ACFSC4_09555 [Deinococcus malanensis]|uniref:hypothetical protein n=1 Tax=Deinococcus malanensis TaxID=1706855 RepID=UPI0036341E1D
MTQPEGERSGGEVLISGLDTGPCDAERENRSPTEDVARLVPTAHPRRNLRTRTAEARCLHRAALS